LQQLWILQLKLYGILDKRIDIYRLKMKNRDKYRLMARSDTRNP